MNKSKRCKYDYTLFGDSFEYLWDHFLNNASETVLGELEAFLDRIPDDWFEDRIAPEAGSYERPESLLEATDPVEIQEALKSFGGGGFGSAYSVEAALWSFNNLAKELHANGVFAGTNYAFENTAAAGAHRQAVINTHSLTKILSGIGKKYGAGPLSLDEDGNLTPAAVNGLISTITSATSIAPSAVFVVNAAREMNVINYIRDFHNSTSLTSGYEYTGGQRKKLQTSSDVKTIQKLHRKFLTDNAVKLINQREDALREFNAGANNIQQDIDDAQSRSNLYDTLSRFLETGDSADINALEASANQALAAAVGRIISLDENIQYWTAYASAGEANEKIPQASIEGRLDELKAARTQAENERDAFQSELDLIRNERTTAQEYIDNDNDLETSIKRSEYDTARINHASQKLAAAEQLNEYYANAGATGAGSDSLPQSVRDLDGNLDRVQRQITEFNNQYDYDTDAAARNAEGATYASRILSVISSSVGLGTTVASGDSDAVKTAGAGLGLAGSLTGLGSTILGSIGSHGVQGVKAKANLGIASKGALGLSSLVSVASSGLNLSQIASQLNDPNLSARDRTYLEAEVGLQATTTALSAIEGGMTIAEASVKAGSKAAKFFAKAAPLVGGIAAIAGAINPAKWAEFEKKEEYADSVRARDDYSSDLLADLLDESLVAEKGIYGASTAIDAAAGVTGAVLDLIPGIGTVASLIVSLVGGVISAIIQAFQQVALEAIADRYAQQIRTNENGNEQSVEDYFDNSFDQQQQETRDHYQNFVDGLVTGPESYDQVFTLGSQTLTTSDLDLAGKAKVAGELGKSAKHFFEQYTDAGGWNRNVVQLEEQIGNDIIRLPNYGGGKSYLTFSTPLLASGEENFERSSTGKNEYTTELTISDLAGWTVEDASGNATFFDFNRLVFTAEDGAGNTRSVDFTVNAGDGNDGAFMQGAAVNFTA